MTRSLSVQLLDDSSSMYTSLAFSMVVYRRYTFAPFIPRDRRRIHDCHLSACTASADVQVRPLYQAKPINSTLL